jgi:hypothetical protein
MKKIPLTQGKFAIVDDEDFEWLNQLKWCAKKNRHLWYVVRGGKQNGVRWQMKMHRLILNAPDGIEVDHRDGNGLNNQRANLRLCSRQQNCANKRVRNQFVSSQFKGVCFLKRRKKWLANISFNNRTQFIGEYTSEVEAARAYDKKAYQLFGEFAHLNFPERQVENNENRNRENLNKLLQGS